MLCWDMPEQGGRTSLVQYLSGGRRALARGVPGLAMAAALAIATPAYGQINFYTQGFFTSGTATCNSMSPIIGAPQDATCTVLGFTLAYTAAPLNPGPISSGSVISLGQLRLTGTGSLSVPPPTINFTVLVRQTAPTSGSGTFMGLVSGNVATDGPNGDFSSLKWIPNSVINVQTSIYQLIFDNVGPAAGVGLGIPINQTRGINALVTTVPEPASVVLLAGGLAAVAMLTRRNRKQLRRGA